MRAKAGAELTLWQRLGIKHIRKLLLPLEKHNLFQCALREDALDAGPEPGMRPRVIDDVDGGELRGKVVVVDGD